jgi:hypothetical protein
MSIAKGLQEGLQENVIDPIEAFEAGFVGDSAEMLVPLSPLLPGYDANWIEMALPITLNLCRVIK